MNKTKEMYGMDNYKEHETRPVNPQKYVAAPTIRIAYQDITMNDMFTKPEHVKQLKELQEVIDTIEAQTHTIYRKGMKPTSVIVDYNIYRLIREVAVDGMYTPAYMTSMNISDKFMGLEIAVVQGDRRDEQYVRVVI